MPVIEETGVGWVGREGVGGAARGEGKENKRFASRNASHRELGN